MSIELRALGAAIFAGLFVVVGTLCIATLNAPTAKAPSLPVVSPAVEQSQIIEGSQYFQNSCARCHGTDAYGKGDAPSLVDEDMSNGEIIKEIQFGENKMPAFNKKYSVQQIYALTEFIRSLKS